MKAVAQRYARALVDVAMEQGAAEKVKAELAALCALWNESGDLRNVLASPAVARAHKRVVVDELASRMGLEKATRNFLHVLVENRRAMLLPHIQQAYDAALNARLNVAEAEVTSARELAPAERDALEKALARLTGKRVLTRYALDPALLAGARVRIGSTIYDGSVREQLNRLRAKLATE